MEKALGIEINHEYASEAGRRTSAKNYRAEVRIREGNFFTMDWQLLLSELPDPLLVIGNPPWVTNSALGRIGSSNVPEKENLHHHAGLDAVTGKSNFDISEWLLLRIFERLNGRTAVMAMLCKTAVARKVLEYAWKKCLCVSDAQLFLIDAQKYFGATVEACFMVCQFTPNGSSRECRVSSTFVNPSSSVIGYRDGALVADIGCYEKRKHLRGVSSYKWRSGIKHDCAKVMEFQRKCGQLRNSLNKVVEIEGTYLFPMLKSSDVANGTVAQPTRWMLVPQSGIGDDTAAIEDVAPKTWTYLKDHRTYLDARGSIIYANRPPFSIFGVGDYSFAPWKVAISGFYKRLKFQVIGSSEGRPIMLDDTAYFLPCQSKQEADLLAAMLNSQEAEIFFRSFIFWDAKRPITAALLSRLSIERLAVELGKESELNGSASSGQLVITSA